VSGSTNINVTDTLPATAAAYNPVGIAVVGVNGTSSLSNFTLAGNNVSTFDHTPVINEGAYFYFLGSGTGSTGCVSAQCYSLYSLPSQGAMLLPIAISGAQNIWQETSSLWEDRQTELRDGLRGPLYRPSGDLPTRKGPAPVAPLQSGLSVWAKAIGSWTNSRDTAYQTAGGRTFAYDLGYNQNTGAILGGADFMGRGLFGPRSAIDLGLLGGYIDSNLNFGAGGSLHYTGGTLGASASLMSNGFYADGLFKADLLDLGVNGLTLMNSATTHADTFGGLAETGYRYDIGQYFIEPNAVLTYSTTQIGQLQQFGVAYNFGNGDDFRGAVGGRVGMEVPNFIDNSHALQASLTGRYWGQFNGNAGNTVDILSGNASQAIGNYTVGQSYGEVKGNLALQSYGPGWSAFVNAGVKFNNQFDTVTAKGGVTYSF